MRIRSPPGSLDVGGRHQRFAELPGRAQLDAAVSERPVMFLSQDGHAAWVNTKALAAAGITKKTAAPPDGVIVHDVHGEPTGLLKDAAISLVTRVCRSQPARIAPAPCVWPLARRTSAASPVFRRSAIQSTISRCTDEARRAGELAVRVYAAFPATPQLEQSGLAVIEDATKRFSDDPVFKAGAASISLDE